MSEPRKPPTLASFRATISGNVRLIGRAPYSHNIVGLTLQMIDEHYGRAEANKAIDDFGLKKKGWEYQPCDHCGHWPCGCGG